ncbi:sensor histidine kinase [Paenibacillaceae bacterium WGS1546]|uniref:cache domain-containing sensor histidine kinase n=1 Tax=Cohnella sp. WGS1546 TaxID=3366810 RepID=UPI00372D4B1A
MKRLLDVCQRFNDLKIQDKIFIAFIFVIVLSALGVGISSYYKSSAILGEKTSRYNMEAVEQISTSVEYTLERIDELAGILAFDQTIQRVLNENLERMSDQELISATNDIESIMITHYNSRIMRSIEIYGSNGLVIKVPSSFDREEDESDLQLVLDGAASARGKTKWFNHAANEGLLRAAKEINDLQTGIRPLGTVMISLKAEMVADLLRDVHFDRSGSVLLMDENGGMVTPAGQFKPLFGEDAHNQVFSAASGSSIYSFEGKDYLVSFKTSSYTGWKTIGIISFDKLYEDSHAVREWIIVATLVIVLLAFILARFFAQTITLPIKRLLKPMKLVQMGETNVSFPVGGKDEIGILSTGVNHMVSQIHALVEDAYKGKIMLQQSEFKALQAQINPHFLYNTLESINWMAKMKGADQICGMVSALGDLMRISISTEKEYISIEEETKYIADYLYIQKVRFGDRIETDIRMEEALLPTVIPKLILQPIVENALLHGVQKKKGKGWIKISGRTLEDCILFVVEDNGVGMDKAHSDKLLAGMDDTETESGGGIGVRNVHRRIRYIYGASYGVSIDSIPGEGTSVQVRIARTLP